MNELTRRTFIRGTAAAAATTLIPWDNPLFAATGDASAPFDLVAVRNGEAVEMFKAGIEALGGMEAFVKKGQRVVVKPNIAWDRPPEIPANTNPDLVKAVVKACYDAGAGKVVVFDHTCHNWKKSYVKSGIEKAAKDAGAEVVSGSEKGFYEEVEIPKGEILKKAKVHREILKCDVFVNMPVLKNHSGAKLTMAMKNLMGIVEDRGFWHKNGLDDCIAEFCLYPKRPDLNILDAYRILRRNGPQGKSPEDGEIVKYQILGRDIVAVDAAGARLFDKKAKTLRYIDKAGKLGIGQADLSKLSVKRITLGA
jgi:uncharacterized protein (DUF362 family)